MKNVILLFAISFCIKANGQQLSNCTSGKFLNQISGKGEEKIKYNYNTSEATNHTFGYEIFANDTLIFHQFQMPGKPEGTGFSTKENAAKVAQRVILKLEHPVMPPIVSTAELKLLNIK